MRQMKDSGIEWIGQIPEEWKVNKSSQHLSEIKNLNDDKKELNALKFTFGNIVKKNYTQIDDELLYTLSKYTKVKKNDIIINGLNLEFDFITQRVGIVCENGIITSTYLSLHPQNVIPLFAVYLLKSYDYCKVFHSLGRGLRKTLTYSDLKKIPLVIAPLNEQQRIADYLEAQCARIDETMELVRQSKEKLRAYKLSLITEAVTKGLDPDVPMKDSGLPWIGEIPAGWKKIRLKYLTKFIIDCPHETPAYDTDGIYFVIRTADQDVGTLKSQEKMYRLSYDEYNRRTRRAKLEKNDIVYGREGERWGLACIVPESDIYCLGQRVMQFRCSKKYNSRFIMWQLNSYAVYLQGIKDTLGSTSPHVNISTITNFLLMCPPLPEQQRIAAYLDEKCARIDALLAEKDELLDKLAEYKKSLIFECVTGKREVAA